MIVATGVDIVKISRFEGKADSPAFMKKIFTQQEQDYLKNRKTQSMAGLFAAKEAVAKALGTGFKNFYPCDIEIAHDNLGKPYVKLYGNAKKIFKKNATHPLKKRKRKGCISMAKTSINISISHNETDAIAFAVIAF